MATSIVASMIIDRARTGTRGWDLPRSFRRSPQVCAQDSSVFGKDARAGKAEQADGVRPPGLILTDRSPPTQTSSVCALTDHCQRDGGR